MLTAQDFFERAREASRDADQCRRQIVELEHRAKSLGGTSFEPRTRSTPNPQRMEDRIARYVDMEARLAERMDADYKIIDMACAVLYGTEQDGEGGLCKQLSSISADVLWWRYLDDATWAAVGRKVERSPRTCQSLAKGALAWMDETGYARAIIDFL